VRLPAEYYSSPASEIRPLFPRGMRIGCGIASAAFLVLLFAGGAWLSGGGAGRMMAFALQLIQIDLGSMYAKDVGAEEKKSLDDELTALQRNVKEGNVPVSRVQGVMTTLRPAVSDKKLTREEVRQLVKAARAANANASASPSGQAAPKTRS